MSDALVWHEGAKVWMKCNRDMVANAGENSSVSSLLPNVWAYVLIKHIWLRKKVGKKCSALQHCPIFPAVDKHLLHQPANIIFSFQCLWTDQLNLGAVSMRLLVLINRVAVNRALTPGSQVLVQIFAWCFPQHKCTKYAVGAEFGQSIWLFCTFYGMYLVRTVHFSASGKRESSLWSPRLLAS